MKLTNVYNNNKWQLKINYTREKASIFKKINRLNGEFYVRILKTKNIYYISFYTHVEFAYFGCLKWFLNTDTKNAIKKMKMQF